MSKMVSLHYETQAQEVEFILSLAANEAPAQEVQGDPGAGVGKSYFVSSACMSCWGGLAYIRTKRQEV